RVRAEGRQHQPNRRRRARRDDHLHAAEGRKRHRQGRRRPAEHRGGWRRPRRSRRIPATTRKASEMNGIDDLINDAVRRMDKSVETTQHEFNSIRTGRASAALLDHVAVDYYGTPTPLNQLATINVPEPRMLTVQPFDPSSLKAIEKAIMESDLGLTPSNDGKIIRLPIPQLTEERRKDLVKVVRQRAEDGRVAV